MVEIHNDGTDFYPQTFFVWLLGSISHQKKNKTDSDSSRLSATSGSHPMLPTMAKITKCQCRILLCDLFGCTVHAMDHTSEKVTSLKSDEEKRE
jgi:hypothetical protein